MNKVELLAPAGNMECLKAAIDNGANACYLGGKNFSARAFANNFSDDELLEAIEYAHLRDVKIYVTLNTLLNDHEFPKALQAADFYYRSHVDALLIQDLGLYYVLKERYPDFELHCSTQMHVHNLSGIENAKKMGFRRVVIPRESSLEFIKEACQKDIEIETFVHGALCVSYSGQCLMSSSTKARSANKGMCAQCCRLRYELYDSHEHKIATDTPYLLSPKDMFLLQDLPKLIEAGVSSFKIEGRMKSAAYVGYVVKMYRKAIDAYYAHEDFKISNQELDNLKALFNRGFTNEYLYDKDDIFGQATPNHLGIRIGKTIGYRQNKILIYLEHDLHQFDGIRIKEEGCICNMLYKDGILVKEGHMGETLAIPFKKNINGPVYLTIDHNLEEEIQSTPALKVPLTMEITIRPSEKVSIKLIHDMQTLIYESEIEAQKALKKPLDEDTILRQFSKLNDTPYYLDDFKIAYEESFLSISQLNEIRRKAIAAFNEYRLNSFKRNISETQVTYSEMKEIDDYADMIQKGDIVHIGQDEYVFTPIINNKNDYHDKNGIVISEFGGLLKQSTHKIAYYSLNCLNSYCYEFFLKLGFEKIILSSEIKADEAATLIENFMKRNNIEIHPYVLSKGKRTLMFLKADAFKKYPEARYLSDGRNVYTIRYQNDVVELLEKSMEKDEKPFENCVCFKIDN